MEAWKRTLTEDRRCMDCRAELGDLEGCMEFHGRPPYVELVGHLCEPCWEWREELRRYRGQKA